MTTIRCCKHNLKTGTKKALKKIVNRFEDVKVQEKGCLGDCKMCAVACFVEVGKKQVKAKSKKKLVSKLKDMLK